VAGTQITFATSLAFAATERRHRFCKGEPKPRGVFDPQMLILMGEFGGKGLIQADPRIEVGDRVFPETYAGQRNPASGVKVVAAIDQETRAGTGEWLLTWAQVPMPRDGEAAAPVTLDPERFADVLLAWAYERTNAGQNGADLLDFAPGDIPLDCAMPLANHLQAAGLLSLTPDTTTIALTTEGITAAQTATAERTNPTRRAEALRNGIVQWIYEADGAENTDDYVTFYQFLHDPRCTFRGRFFTLNEVEHEYTYLVDRGLLIERRPWWLWPSLTPSGRDCAAYRGGNVYEQLNPKPQQQGPMIITHGNNNQINTGDDATQTAHAPTPAHADPAPPETDSTMTPPTPTAAPETPAQPGTTTSSLTRKVRAVIKSPEIVGIGTLVIAIFTVLIWYAATH
jgi:hypothetical protein